MSLAGPPPMTSNPFRLLLEDIRLERNAKKPYPPGPLDFNMRRTRTMARAPLRPLLALYEEHGPIFTMRILHQPNVWMIGPEANHYILVSHFQNFHWREGGFGELIPLLGDGLLTIDGDFHRRSRRIMLPAFHRERIAASTTTMLEEAERALASWHPGAHVDLYHWTRALALRIAMRALFGFQPGASTGSGFDAAHEFETALSFYGTDFALRVFRGPGTPWRRMQRARHLLDGLIFSEIERRRRTGERGEDILSMLLDATDEDGGRLSDKHVRDEVMTLLFAGHDTTTSTVAFLFYELARHPHVLERLYAEQDATGGEGELPELEMALDETLRLYPPAWVGPRQAVQDFEFAGHEVSAGTNVQYSSWVSHRLPEVFPDPEAFIPERFTPERKAALPKGAYVPFGAGSRTCIGMRFGQAEIRLITKLILQRHRLELQPGWTLRIRQMPTLSPIGGLPMVVRERGLPVQV